MSRQQNLGLGLLASACMLVLSIVFAIIADNVHLYLTGALLVAFVLLFALLSFAGFTAYSIELGRLWFYNGKGDSHV